VIFLAGARRHLGFQKFEILTACPLYGPICIIVPNFIKIGQKVAEIWRFNGFHNGGRPPSWILEIQFLTVRTVKIPILHNRAKFRKDWSNC